MLTRPWRSARRPAPWPWRDYLTREERATLAKIDAAKKHWAMLNRERGLIVNRAIQRAKFAAKKPAKPGL